MGMERWGAGARGTRRCSTMRSPPTDTITHDRVDRVDEAGSVTLRMAGRLHHIGVGRTHARIRVLILVHDLNIRIIKATTGGLLRYLILDPTCHYQPPATPKAQFRLRPFQCISAIPRSPSLGHGGATPRRNVSLRSARTRALVAAAAVAGLALLGPRMLNDAELRAQKSPHCREHRRLLGRGAEHVHSLCRKEWRFIGNSSPSSLTSTDSRSPGRLEIEMITLYALAAAVGIGVLWLGTNIKVVKQFERGVVFRFGRVQSGLRGPGLTMLIPIADRLEKVNMQIITMPVPAQDGITRDNVTVRVDAVIYFQVSDPVRAAVDVQDYVSAIGQVAQTSLRSIIGKSNLDDLLSNREHLNQGLELMIDSPALGWGVQIDRVEIKDVVLPDSMKRSIARQAEAERERRARVITAEGELQASEKLAQAAEVMAEHPAALQLRLLETVVEVAAEKNSTLVLPFPVELLRFLERATPQASERRDKATGTDAGAASNRETLTLEPPRIPDDARGLELHTRIADTFQRDQ